MDDDRLRAAIEVGVAYWRALAIGIDEELAGLISSTWDIPATAEAHLERHGLAPETCRFLGLVTGGAELLDPGDRILLRYAVTVGPSTYVAGVAIQVWPLEFVADGRDWLIVPRSHASSLERLDLAPLLGALPDIPEPPTRSN